MLRCCEQCVLQCSVTLPLLQEKQRNHFAEHVIGLGRAQKRRPIAKSEPKKSEPEGM